MSEETGKRLKKVADELFDENQSKMARAMGMTPQAANKYFQGDREPGFKFLKRLVSIDINASWVIGGIPPMKISDIKNAQISQINFVNDDPEHHEEENDYFSEINQENLTDAERRLLAEVKQFSNFLKNRDLNPYVKRLLLEQLIESIGRAIEPPPRDHPDN